LNTYSNDYIIINKDGTSFVPLGIGNGMDIRAIYNPDGTERMVHSLHSACFLKIEPSNTLSFERPLQGEDIREIVVQEQGTNTMGNTYYDKIFKLNINEMSLRELILT